MININILKQFLNQSYFTQGTIIIKERTEASYDSGHIQEGIVSTETLKKKKVLVPISANEMNDLGLGQYNDYENYYLATLSQIKFQNGSLLQRPSLVEYKGKNYQIIKQLDFSTHGFYSHILTSYNGVLND